MKRRRILVGDCEKYFRKKKPPKMTKEELDALVDKIPSLASHGKYLPKGAADQLRGGREFQKRLLGALDHNEFAQDMLGAISPQVQRDLDRMFLGVDQGRGSDQTSVFIGSGQVSIAPHDHEGSVGTFVPIGEATNVSFEINDINQEKLARVLNMYASNTQQNHKPVRYVIHEGVVTSRTDGDTHRIDYIAIMRLYGVERQYCRLFNIYHPQENDYWKTVQYRVVHLFPDPSGRYHLNERDRQT